MNAPVLRMVNAALEHVTTGANAQLLALTLDGADARPDPVAKFVIPPDDSEAAPQQGLVDWPIVVSVTEEPAVATLKSVAGRAFDAPALAVRIMLVTRDTMDPVQAWLDTDYYLRAIVLSLLAGLFASGKEAARKRGPVTVVKLNALTWQSADHDIPGGKITGIVRLDVYASHNGT